MTEKGAEETGKLPETADGYFSVEYTIFPVKMTRKSTEETNKYPKNVDRVMKIFGHGHRIFG